MNQPARLRDIHGVANVLNGLNCGEARTFRRGAYAAGSAPPLRASQCGGHAPTQGPEPRRRVLALFFASAQPLRAISKRATLTVLRDWPAAWTTREPRLARRKESHASIDPQALAGPGRRLPRVGRRSQRDELRRHPERAARQR